MQLLKELPLERRRKVIAVVRAAAGKSATEDLAELRAMETKQLAQQKMGVTEERPKLAAGGFSSDIADITAEMHGCWRRPKD